MKNTKADKKESASWKIFRKAAGVRIVQLIMLVVMIAVCQDILLTALSKGILECVMQGQLKRLLQLSVMLALTLAVCTVMNVLYKSMRFELMRHTACQMEDALLLHHKKLVNWRTIPNADVLGYLKETAPRASSGTVEYILNGVLLWAVILGTSLYTIYLNPLVFGIILIFSVLTVLWMRKDTEKLPQMYGTYFEHLRVLDTKLWEQVKNHEAASLLEQEKVQKGYLRRNEQFILDLRRIKRIDNKVFFAKRFGPLLLMVIVALIGGWLQTKQIVSISEIYAMMVMIPSMAGAMLEVPSLLAGRKKIVAARKTLDEYFALKEVSDEKNCGVKTIGQIEFQNVSYTYPGGNEAALKNISLSIPRGLSCLAGPSGGGKSTILLLMMRLLKCTQGEVRADGRNVQQFDRGQYYAQIGYAGQKPTVLPGTIRWNIVLEQSCDKERLRAALSDAALDEWIQGLEEGIDTQVDTDSISSGEQQKICMARLLYRRVSVLVLDEATSAMDPASAQTIMAALRRRAEQEGLAVVYAAHDAGMIQSADRVFWIEKGELRECSELKGLEVRS